MLNQANTIMYAIEFKSKIKRGLIEVPEEYREQLRREAGKNVVRVIVLTDKPDETSSFSMDDDLIGRLLLNPLQLTGFTPLSREEVYERR